MLEAPFNVLIPTAFAEEGIDPRCHIQWGDARGFRYPRDPLILDLDADGLETVGLNAGLHFDHNADNIATGTGWVKSDDAFLVRDLNGNGEIDTGRELFGDNTLLPNGQLAANGYAALAALDSNADGFIDAADTAFAELKLWQDHNQDGVSQANELKTLTEAGILNLGVSGALKNQSLGNGNVLAREGFFVRTDGSTGTAGELNLAIDTFNTRFTDNIPVAEPVKTLPNMSGSGKVRELWQAASQSGALAGLLAQFAAAPTRQAQLALLDPILGAWADTSGMTATLDDRDPNHYRIEYVGFGSLRRSDHLNKTALDGGTSSGGNEVAQGGLRNIDDPRLDATYKAAINNWNRKLHILEAFNGQYFFNLPSERNETPGASVGMRKLDAGSTPYYQLSGDMLGQVRQTLAIDFPQQQLNLLDESMAALKDSVYGALVLQTRVKPLLDLVELHIDEQGIRLDATALNAEIASRLAADPIHGLGDLLDLDRYAADLLIGSNWDGMAGFDSLIKTLPQTPELSALLNDYKVRQLGAGNDWNYNGNGSGSDNDIVMGGAGNDTHYGNNGNDRLYGEEGDDLLFGGEGNDLLSGGAGNDSLYGDNGADTYVFSTGSGHDTIYDHEQNGQRLDTVRFLGLNPADVSVAVDYNDNLLFTIAATGETLRVPYNGNWWGRNGVGQYVFDDGTTWTHDDAVRASVPATTEGDDIILASSADEVIDGKGGNDRLIGQRGNDLIDGGAGNDLLIGSSGLEGYYEDGQWKVRRSQVPNADANGNDTYLFGRGDGQDTVIDGDYTAGNTDVLRFKEGVAPGDVSLRRVGNELILAISGTDDRVTLHRYFEEQWNGADGAYVIERIEFADGTSLTKAQVQAVLFAGTLESDAIVGTRNDDVLHGGAGNDVLEGRAGNDHLAGGDGDDVLRGGSGDDILDGGAGNDVLRGNDFDTGAYGYYDGWYYTSGGSDTYLFGFGDGHDTIIDLDWSQGTADTVVFKAGVRPEDVRFSRIGNDLVATLGDGTDTLRVQDWFNSWQHGAKVAAWAFEDGTVLDIDWIESHLLLEGTSGDDTMVGSASGELIRGNAGNDTLIGNGGNDTLLGGDGNDKIWGLNGNDVIEGGDGDDEIQAYSGNDSIDGGAGNDRISGSGGSKTVDGGSGQDVMSFDSAAVDYRFTRGSGQDVIRDRDGYISAATFDRIVLGDGVLPTDVRLTRVGGDLVLSIRDTDDTLTVQSFFLNPQYQIESIDFADGTVFDTAEIERLVLLGEAGDDVLIGYSGRNDLLVGGAGSDKLSGRSGADTLDGGAGSDWLAGEEGADSYLFGRGAGKDVIQEAWETSTVTDAIVLAADIVPEDVIVRRVGDDMVLSLRDTEDSLTVRQGFFYSGAMGIEEVRFADGAIWNHATLLQRSLLATEGDDRLEGTTGADVYVGLAGDDSLVDPGGNDTYRFGIGDGQDLIVDQWGTDVLEFQSGIGPNDVDFTVDGADLLATVRATGDSVRVRYWANGADSIDTFRFESGTVLNRQQVVALLNVGLGQEILYGSPGDDGLVGSDRDSTIYALEGNDDVSGAGGSDQIFGEAGNDVLRGNGGQDFLYGDVGNDVLEGGAGRDLLNGGEGNNRYLMSAGSELDVIEASLLDVADDTVEFAPGIRPEDVSVQLGDESYGGIPGDIGYRTMVVGIGGNDALLIRSGDGEDIGRAAVRRFRFADGTELSLAEMAARADSGIVGEQYRSWNADDQTLTGSQADDYIYAGTGNDTIDGRGNNDQIETRSGDDVVNAGYGDDHVNAGSGSDLIAGGKGADRLYGGRGSDTFAFNYGDGEDTLSAHDYQGDGGIDTLSLGADISLSMLSLYRDGNALKLQVDGGLGGSVSMYASFDNTLALNSSALVDRLQLVDVNGVARRFDFRAFIESQAVRLVGSSQEEPLQLAFDILGNFETTAEEAPAGGRQAIAYAQTGNLFGTAYLPNNTPTDGDDVVIGTSAAETIDGLGGNDMLLGEAGDDDLDGGAGNDWLYGGRGDDRLTGGGGDDALFGGAGGDTYVFQSGDGHVLIEDGHEDCGDDDYGGEAFAAYAYDYGGDYGYGGDEGGYGEEVELCGPPNILHFGPGIRPEDLSFREEGGDLVVETGVAGDRIVLRNFDATRRTKTRSVDIFRFEDGTEIGPFEGSIALTVEGTPYEDEFNGTSGNDVLIGGYGDDLFESSTGNDRLVGGAGSDTYFFTVGSGDKSIEDFSEEGQINTLEIQGEIYRDDISLMLVDGVMVLKLGEEKISFPGFDPGVPGGPPIDVIRLGQTGELIDFLDLLDDGTMIVGTENPDTLTGTGRNDVILGLESDDLMIGGHGNDRYVLGANGGTDTIIDLGTAGGMGNVLVFPDTVARDDLVLSFDARQGDLIIRISRTDNEIRLRGFDPQDPFASYAVERFYFPLSDEEISYEELLESGFVLEGEGEMTGSVLHDTLIGGDAADVLDATPGSDLLLGEGGNDTYTVNLGDGIVTIDDLAEPGSGNILRFGAGIEAADLRNNLRFGQDDDGNRYLILPFGEDEAVHLRNFDPENVLGPHAVDRFEFADGTVVDYATLVSWTFVVEGNNAGNELLGTNVADRLYGYDGDDLLVAGDGNDVLTGGTGFDELEGGNGRDAYVFNLGDGVDDIYDVIDEGVGNIVTFGPGIAREDIVLEFDGDALLVRYGNGGDSFYVADFAPEGAEGPTVIDTFEFADGSSVSLRELLNVAPEVAGSVGDQTAIEDASFVLQLPDGLFVDGNGDAISEWISVSSYERFPSWLNYDTATRTLYGVPDNDAVGSFDVTVQGMDSFGASAYHSFRVEVLNTNDAPDVAAPLVDGLATEDAAFRYIVPAGSFADVDAGDSLTISAASANGDPLPAWLTFDPVMRTFSGVPVNADVGVYSLRVTATDLAGAQVSQLFAVSVANTNDAPTVSVALADVLATEDVPFSHALPAGAFADEDLGDQLTFSAAQEGGAALPDWLVFDPATGTFSGTPGNDHVGVLRVRVTATDLSGSAAHQVFSIGVANVNDAPEALHDIGAHAAVQGQAFSYVLPADAFGDVDAGDSLRYDASLANGDPLPVWLSFDAETGAFSGMPANGDVGLVQIRVTATDLAGASAQQTFALSIVNVNDAPVLAEAPADQQAMEDATFVYALPAGTFDDIDAGDVLSFQASLANGEALPSWLSFDAATATFRGTPGNGDVGQISLRVVATDMAGATATASFSLAVGNVNDAPIVGTLLSDSAATEDQAFSYTIPTDAFSDIDAGDLLGYSATLANGDALPGWLSFDAANGTFSGTPGNGDVGRVDVRVTATDLDGASASQTFALSVENVNDAPSAGGDTISGNEDAPLLIAAGALLANDHDIDPTNDFLAISAVGEARNGTVALGANGEVVFTPDADYNGEAGFSYTVADGHGGFANGQVSIAVGAVNDAPVASQALADQSARSGTAFTYALPQNAFTDVDAGDRLAYAATLADGGVLPAWLAFDAASGTFSGTPSGGTTSLRIQVTATDLAGASASQSFGLDVTGGNAIPVANPDGASVSEDCKLWACGNVLANDSDADAGTRLRVGDPGIRHGTYGTLTLLGNGSYSYVLDNCSSQVQGLGAGEQVVDRFGYKASDGTDFAVGELAVTVSGANDKPWLAKSLADRTLAKDSDFRWQIPAGSFADRDRNDTLTYSARLTNGSALPSWLKFDAVTQTFSGRTPANAKGNVEVVVSAKDGHGECSVAADTFKISFGSGGGCGKGNEGVGNGEDPPPPGHGDDHNDGPGSGPGNPGRRGDRHDDDRPHGAGDRNHDDDWTKGWGQGGKGKDFAYLDLGLIERYRNPCDDESRAGHGREGGDFEHRWAEMDRTLNRMLIESERAGLGHDGGHGLDPRAVHGLAHGGMNTMRGGIDPVSLTADAGASLKGFHGLQEGIQRLG